MMSLIFLALAAAGQTPAGQPPATPAAPAAPADLVAALSRAGMSPAGIAAIRGIEPGARAATRELLSRGQAIEAEIRAAALAGDVDRLARGMQARDALLARYSATRTATTIGLLRSMTVADRRLMMRSVAGQSR